MGGLLRRAVPNVVLTADGVRRQARGGPRWFSRWIGVLLPACRVRLARLGLAGAGAGCVGL